MECHYDITTSYSYTNAFTNTLSNKTRTQYIDFPEINFVSPIQDTMKIRVTCNVTYYTSSSPYNRYIKCQPSISVEQPYLEERHLIEPRLYQLIGESIIPTSPDIILISKSDGPADRNASISDSHRILVVKTYIYYK